ncbi:hypothetical protein OSH11_21750, partial [Kaistia dalseonensis]|nr:hypothetical protein [Kaistia dalseonensis]MDQ0439974.1 hypothetical protein [Kaistia dalseonensis]
MPSLSLHADDVTILARRLPGIIPLCLFDGDKLTYPEEAAADIDTLLADANWRLPSKDELRAYAADKRWRVENGGIVVDGAAIRTDDKSQSRVSGAALLAFSDPDLVTIDWEA